MNCPLARALVWCGWDVIPIGIALNPQHDVTKLGVQTALRGLSEGADLEFYAPECKSLSRARGIPLGEGLGGPRALRNAAYVRGVPGLSHAEQSLVDSGNAMADFALERAGAAVEANRGGRYRRP